MLAERVIPCLLLKENGLVKTRRFKKPVYVGDPINAVKIFNEKEVDELILLDIEASKNEKEPDYAFIEQIAGECFMPLCYGGGIRTLDQAAKIFASGIEKVSLQASILENPWLIEEIAARYGTQSVVVSIDIKKNLLGKHQLYSGIKKKKNMDWKGYLLRCIEAGAGEILINSVDNDGMKNGMDLKLIAQASDLAKVPLIAVGGVGSLEDIRDGIQAGANAVAVGSMFVFQGPHNAVLITYPEYDELEELLTQ